MHRWYVCGLREVRKAVKLHKAKAVVLAPNIEHIAEGGGLDDYLQTILSQYVGGWGLPACVYTSPHASM